MNIGKIHRGPYFLFTVNLLQQANGYGCSAVMLILLSPSLGRDTPSMRSLYQQWQTGILGMTAKRLVDGAKCTRVWHWWLYEVRGTRFPSTARSKVWSSSSTSCAMKPCPSLYIAFRRFRMCCLAWWRRTGCAKPWCCKTFAAFSERFCLC